MRQTRKRWVVVAAVGFALTVGSSASAALIGYSNGQVYDDAQDITWLRDANYACTSGSAIAPDVYGRMHWAEATQWAAELEFGGSTDWRLASVDELAYMYDVNGVTGASTGPFIHLQPRSYASSTVVDDARVWDFHFGTGARNTPGKDTWFYAWAVHDGVPAAPAPAPAPFLLLGSGLTALAVRGRKGRRRPGRTRSQTQRIRPAHQEPTEEQPAQ